MNHPSLFAPSPRRKRGLILTLSGSLLFHGSLIGVAALYYTPPTPESPTPVSLVDFVDLPTTGDPAPPATLPSEPAPESTMPTLAETTDVSPPSVELNADDMMQATPVPRPATRTASSRPVTGPSVPHNTRAVGNGPANGTGTSGTHPGSAGRWVTPRPAYPAALRMARVQGSGTVRVTTDTVGRVVGATVVKSTGNSRLDDNTCQAAKSEWSGPPNATTLVPISYQLQ